MAALGNNTPTFSESHLWDGISDPKDFHLGKSQAFFSYLLNKDARGIEENISDLRRKDLQVLLQLDRKILDYDTVNYTR